MIYITPTYDPYKGGIQCAAWVWKRDTYRYTGGTPSGFTMHYKKTHCRRSTKRGFTLCWQHERMR
jgi:hypothetical protein